MDYTPLSGEDVFMRINQKSPIRWRGQCPEPGNDAITENPDYLSRQLITCIGNKRALLAPISHAVERVKKRLGKKRLRCFDVFSGSGVVSRLLKAHSSRIVSNDLEEYAAVTGRCYLANRSEIDCALLREIIRDINASEMTDSLPRGFIEEMYAPRDEANITPNDRIFYTKNNARRLDSFRRLINLAPADMRDLLIAPLLSEASVHANTSGVFKGFHKNRHTGIGQFGGSNSDALARILGDIVLNAPLLSNFECEYEVLRDDANAAARQVDELDLAYIDPPYNQHPFGSNYFMLNLIARYEKPKQVSEVSGIPVDWNRSGYNVRSQSMGLMTDLVEQIAAPFLLISFSNEGFINPSDMLSMLGGVGAVDVVDIPYNAFRGSRSFAGRSVHLTEHLFIVEKG